MMIRFALVLLFSTVMLAQPRGPRPWWDREVAKELNLTDVQTKQLAQIQEDFRPRMKTVRDEVNRAEAAVDAAFNEDPVDDAKAEEAINRLAAARGELTKAVSQMDLKLRKVLTAQQWQQLNNRGRGRWPGPGSRHRGAPSSPPTNTSGRP
jgi:Spy/CpxP family protein refolding chaperone